jgi:hypothetical protein
MTTRADTQRTNRETGSRGQKPGQASQRNARAGNGGESAPDEVYGVVSVLYHALQGSQTYGQYVMDARNAGDEELAEFFESCRSEENERAIRAKSLLAERLEDEDAGDESEDSEDDDAEDSEDTA